MDKDNKPYFKFSNPVIVALVSALFGGVLVALVNGQANIILEEKKLQTQLIVQAVKTGDKKQAADNLKFLVATGLVDDPSGKIKELINVQGETSFVLPASESISRGATAAWAGELDNAIEHYIDAIRSDPLNAHAFNLLGYSFFKKKQYMEAITYLETAVRIKPNEPWNHYNLALALWANGNKPQAIKEIEATLILDSKFKSFIKGDNQFKEFYGDQRFKKLIENE